MSTTSQKHRNFVAEPMGEKEVGVILPSSPLPFLSPPLSLLQVTDLAGIGDVLGKRLSSKGFDKVTRFLHF